MEEDKVMIFERHANVICMECRRQQLNGNCEGCIVNILCLNLTDEYFKEKYGD